MKRIVLITGSSSGIGKSIAEYLASKAYIIYAGARKEKDLKKLNEIENVTGIRFDVTIPESIKQAMQVIEEKHGYLDCLINNAGIMGWGAVIDRELEYYRSVFEVNLWGAVSMTKAAYPLLRKSENSPAIFNISSQGSNYTLPFWSPYMMSKCALEAFTGCLRREFMTVGIRVYSIAPGAYKSNMLGSQKKAHKEYAEKYHSEFTAKAIKLLSLPINSRSRRGKSPREIGILIDKLIIKGNRKPRYQPGKQFLPDVLLERFPTVIIDKMISKRIN